MSVNNIFQHHCERITKNGKKTLFWTDSWVNDSPLASQFPRLFHITFQKEITLFKVKGEGWGSIRFRRTLYGETLQQWEELKRLVDEVSLFEETDRVKWKIGSSGKFRVKDVYLHLRAEGSFRHKFLWKIKIPMKVRIFLWEVLKHSILTKDNLLKRGWIGNDQCQFCGGKETIQHLLFSCGLAKLVWQVVCAFHLVRPPKNVEDLFGAWIKSFLKTQRNLVLCGAAALCWTLWKTRNDACFNNKKPNDPANVIYRLCNLLSGWAFLQTDQDRRNIEEGVEKLKMVIREAYACAHGWAPAVLRIAS
jgi:hypothetical protein